MTYNHFKHHRRSNRLKGYDYSRDGAYYVTICAHNHVCLFGKIINGVMILNQLGEIVRNEWLNTPQIRSYVILDTFIIMPNHMRGIIIIDNNIDKTTDTVGAIGDNRKSPIREPHIHTDVHE